MHLKISFLLIFGFLFMSVLSVSEKVKLLLDPDLNNAVNTLSENYLNETFIAQVDTVLTLAQLIVDSNTAPKFVIEPMKSLTNKWRPVYPRLSIEDSVKLNKEYKMALGKFERYRNEDGILNYFSDGAYSSLRVKFEKEEEQRKAAFNDMVQEAKKMAKLRLGLEAN